MTYDVSITDFDYLIILARHVPVGPVPLEIKNKFRDRLLTSAARELLDIWPGKDKDSKEAIRIIKECAGVVNTKEELFEQLTTEQKIEVLMNPENF